MDNDKLTKLNVPEKTTSTHWATNMWRYWGAFCKSNVMQNEKTHELSKHFVSMSRLAQSFWLCHFVCEVSKND